MEIKVSSVAFHRNGSGNSSYQVLFKVVRDREYKNMMATIFYQGEDAEVGVLNRCETCVNVVNLDKITDELDPDYFRLIHKAVKRWCESWSWDTNTYTQVFPLVVGQ